MFYNNIIIIILAMATVADMCCACHQLYYFGKKHLLSKEYDNLYLMKCFT